LTDRKRRPDRAGARRWDQIERRGVRDLRVLEALRRIPRHRFVPEALRDRSYEDGPLAIGEGQTISQPYIVAFMTEAIRPRPVSRVLEIGTGSGYQTVVLASIVAEVFTIEIRPRLFEEARRRFRDLGIVNVRARQGDGWSGWPEEAPFDAILVTAAPEDVPPALLGQLVPGGRMIIPIGADDQTLVRLTRTTTGYEREPLLPVRFVPMTGLALRA
jgi:protein-L-isoaspartate(D-aspartate) O-methyltransferase